MSNSSLLCRIAAVVALVGFLQQPACAVSFVSDDFDDGDIDTNTTGIGTGFSTFIAFDGENDTTGIYENASILEMRNDIHGFRRTSIVSREGITLPTSGDDVAHFVFEDVSFSQNVTGVGTGSTDRVYLGVTSASEAASFEQNPPAGFYIQIESDSIVTSGGNASFNGISQLFYESSTDTRTQLASWTFDTLDFQFAAIDGDGLDFSPSVDFELVLDATGYALTINATGDTVSNLTGSLTGTFAGAGITNEVGIGRAMVFSQNEVYDGVSETATINTHVGLIQIHDGDPAGLACDVDGDGDCDSADFAIIRDNMYTSGGFSDGDVTGDGFIDLRDFRRFKDDPNRVVGIINGASDLAGVVPEPFGCVLLALTATLLGCARRSAIAEPLHRAAV